MSATPRTITHAVATGTTTGLALDQAALIALVTPGAVTKAAGSSAGSVDLSFSAASTAFDYLAKGEVLTLTYTVAIDDGDGGVTPKTFVVTVTGTNDDPVVAAADVTGAVTEQVTPVGNLTDGGTIALADVDLTDTHQIGPTITASAGALGSLTASVNPDTVNGIGGTIQWSYSVAAPDCRVSRQEPDSRDVHFALDDGNGGTSIARSVTITGTNDEPVVATADVTGGDGAGNARRKPDRQRHDCASRRRPHGYPRSCPPSRSAGALGSLTATVDPDTVNGIGGAIKWSYSVAASAVEYLAKGQIRSSTSRLRSTTATAARSSAR